METACTTTADKPRTGRRSFLRRVTYVLGAVAGAAVGIPFIGFLFGARSGKVAWVPLGPVSDFPENQMRRVDFENPLQQPWDGVVANTSVYVRNEGVVAAGRDGEQEHRFLVLASNCAHLGCAVEWFQESGLFMCPCHGGVYYADGERASGPPPRGLYRCVYRVTEKQNDLLLEIQAPHFPTLQNTLQQQA